MDLPATLRVSLLCALVLSPALPVCTAKASSRLDIRAGYDTDPGDGTESEHGDMWVAVTGGRTMTRERGGPLSISLDLALGATAYARLTDYDQISLVVTPAIDYIISQRIAAGVALATEWHLVNDPNRSAWAWGWSLRLREQFSPRVSLIEYFAYRNRNAQGAEYSDTTTSIGFILQTFLGEMWMLGVGGEYAHGDFLQGDTQRDGVVGVGSSSHKFQNNDGAFVRVNDRTLVRKDEDRLSASVALDYAWSERLSSGAEYVVTHVIAEADGENQHCVTLSTTFGF